MIFLLLEFKEIEAHCLKLAREKAPHQRRFSPPPPQPELFPGRTSTVRSSTTKPAVPGETRPGRGAQEISARAPPVYEAAGGAGRVMTVRAGAGGGGEGGAGTLAVRREARELPVSGKSVPSRGRNDRRDEPAPCRETPPTPA